MRSGIIFYRQHISVTFEFIKLIVTIHKRVINILLISRDISYIVHLTHENLKIDYCKGKISAFILLENIKLELV